MKKALLTRAGGRKNNEDYCLYSEKGGFGCFVLADGLGGHRGGASASRVVASTVTEAFNQKPGMDTGNFRHCLEAARHAFLEKQKIDARLAGMKTTLVVLLSDNLRARWGHVGDSRLYYFRSGSLYAQTRDHSVPRHLVDSGEIREEEVRFHEDRNRLTRAFDGSDIERFELSAEALRLTGSDAFLICTDGFWEHVLESEMQQDLNRSNDPESWLSMMEKRLRARVKEGHDNYSAIAIMQH